MIDFFQPSASNKATTGKKASVNDENNKSANTTNGIKPSTKQQQQQQNSPRAENVDVVQGTDKKKKAAKSNAAPATNKQPTTGKSTSKIDFSTNLIILALLDEVANKVNANASTKKQPVAGNVESQRAPVDADAGSDQEDDGQWVTQGSKQVNNRNRNKGKSETSNANTQEISTTTSSSSNRKTTSDNKRTAGTSTSNTSSSANKTEVDVDLPEPSTLPVVATTAAPVTPEPIEVCQLLPTGEDRYTANDNWWKQALNKQQTFSIADIGEWPEREQDEQYTVQKRLIPVKVKALTEKDINVDGNDEINNYKNGRDDEVNNKNQ